MYWASHLKPKIKEKNTIDLYFSLRIKSLHKQVFEKVNGDHL